MRLPIIAALACLSLAALAPQDEEEETLDLRDPFARHAQTENARLEKELEGSWMMMTYHHPGTLIDPADAKGFLIFSDGYLSLTLQARQKSQGFFTERTEYTIQAGAYRYRVSEGRLLQTVGIIGFSNSNPGGDLDFRSVILPEEYQILLTKGLLTLTCPDGRSFRFRRMERTAFPENAVDHLYRLRGAAGEGVDEEDR